MRRKEPLVSQMQSTCCSFWFCQHEKKMTRMTWNCCCWNVAGMLLADIGYITSQGSKNIPAALELSRVAPNCCFTTTHCKPQFWAEGCHKDLQLSSSHSRFCLFSCFPMKAESFLENLHQSVWSLFYTNAFHWGYQNPTAEKAMQPKSNKSPNKDHGHIG